LSFAFHSPLTSCAARRGALHLALCSNEITIDDDGFYRARYHEAASKFFVQKIFRLDIHHC
jgi:hypothetical protein